MAPDSRLPLFEKLKQTATEARALSARIKDVPQDLIWRRPGDRPSIAELLWLIHLADEYRFRPAIDSMVRGLEPRIGHVHAVVLLETDPAPEDDIEAILAQVAASRDRLVERFEMIPVERWSGHAIIVDHDELSCEQFGDDIAQHDAEILREIGHRLFESDLSS